MHGSKIDLERTNTCLSIQCQNAFHRHSKNHRIIKDALPLAHICLDFILLLGGRPPSIYHRGFLITFVTTEYNHRRFLKSLGPNSLDGLPDFQFQAIPDGLSTNSDSESTQDLTALTASIY